MFPQRCCSLLFLYAATIEEITNNFFFNSSFSSWSKSYFVQRSQLLLVLEYSITIYEKMTINP